VYALEIAGETDEALRVAQEAVARSPQSAWLWKSTAWHLHQRGHTELAAAAIDRALACASPADLEAQEHFLDVRADILRETNLLEAVRSAISSYLVRRNEARFVQWLQVSGTAVTAELIAKSLNALGVSAEERERIERLYGTATASPSSDTMKVLDTHLTQIINLARAAGADPVLLSYPFHSQDLETLASRVASRTAAGWINIRELFDARLKTTAREELFVPDGHLSDKGYHLVASVIAADARQRLSRDRTRQEAAQTLTVSALTTQRLS
jgi:hypothetical protein